jgi:hypothetical protein
MLEMVRLETRFAISFLKEEMELIVATKSPQHLQ